MIASATDVDTLVRENLNLVHWFAQKQRIRIWGAGLEFEEVVAALMLVLTRCAQTFDPERGIKFSTYTVKCLSHEVTNVVRRGGDAKAARKTYHMSALGHGGDPYHRRGYEGFIPDHRAPENPLTEERREQIDIVRRVISKLHWRQQFVICRRMEGASLHAIAAQIGVTKERVRQIESKAQRDIRALLGENFLEGGEAPKNHNCAPANDLRPHNRNTQGVG